MIDFKNAAFLKLSPTSPDAYDRTIGPLLIPGERVVAAFHTMRDGVVFTDKRIIAINKQGVTGKKSDCTSLPYSKIQTFMRIILPQVIKIIMPSVTNEVITLVKDTSLAFTLAYAEVFSLAKQISASQSSFMPFLIAGVFYFVANYVVEFLMVRIEKSMDYYK